jgi:uncharacterized protein (DUF362 family)
MDDYTVALYQTRKTAYPKDVPFHPDENYPEYVFAKQDCIYPDNSVYKSVRECFRLLNLDIENYGSPDWNPLGAVIKPGDKVVLKPNFVRDFHEYNDDLYCIITHPSVIRAVLDYVYIALRGDGQIIIADAPQGDADFDNLLEKTKIGAIADLYKRVFDFHIPILDLRKMRYECGKDGLISQRFELKGDPLGYARVDLGRESQFAGLESHDRIYGADYDREETQERHNKTVNEYLVAKTILSADVIISIPKLKAHKKAGFTLNQKNMIGINGDKNWLPHFRIGTPMEGGDEMPDGSNQGIDKIKYNTSRMLIDKFMTKDSLAGKTLCKAVWGTHRNIKKFKRLFCASPEKHYKISSGNWYGNDTVWRTTLDLNRIAIYSDKNGNMTAEPQRRLFSVVDGIIGGEGDGPIAASPKPCGVVLAGSHLVNVDLVCAKIMGFDYKKTPLLKISIAGNGHDTSRIYINSNLPQAKGQLGNGYNWSLQFTPPRGWIGYIELEK